MGAKTKCNRALAAARVPAEPACGVKGCKLAWLDHFTKAGTQKKALTDHFPADFQAAMSSARLISRVRGKKKASA